MRVVFMGTPDFAVPTLAAIAARSDLAEVVAVVTQPDRPRGRGKKLSPSPVKAWAVAHDIPVLQPVRARDAAFVTAFRDLKPDVAVVVAFGQILSQEVLDVPVYGCINVHASPAEVSRSGTDSARHHGGGVRDGHHDDADGCGA